jgi:hypothetical protein
MKIKHTHRLSHLAPGLLILLSTINYPLSTLAQGTAFTYQGRLADTVNPVNGYYDFKFSLYDSASGGTLISGPLPISSIVSNGLFTVSLDFGAGNFTGADRWLDLAVRTNGAGPYTPLSSRQKLTPIPYAITAENVVSGGLAAGIYSNPVNFNNPANRFCGDGGCLTNLNATTLGGLTSTDFWRLNGNIVTSANFLGTLNNLPLEIKVNNAHALRIVPASVACLEGGYIQNSTHGFTSAAIVGGGTSGSINEVFGDYGFIGAGHGAKVGSFSAVVDGAYNVALGQLSFVGTGLGNTNLADYAFIGSGFYNTIQSNVLTSVIVGGHYNTIQPSASWSIIGSGGYNTIQTNSYDSSIVGGGYNMIQPNAQGSLIAGGYQNTNAGFAAAICGGLNNAIQTGADRSTIGGGDSNLIQSNAFASFIGGGRGNQIQAGAFDSTIGGGPYNWILNNANASTIGGGYLNVIQNNASSATIGGGVDNVIQSNAGGSAICGGYYNFIQPNAVASFIGGGTNNLIGTPRSVISGGENNYVAGDYAMVGGGGNNQAIGRSSFVGGGGGRDSSGGGPYGNTASGDWSTVGGGWFDLASGYSSTVGGGAINHATNAYATVPGGGFNVAGGAYSFAAGDQAYAIHQGSFVWADSQGTAFASTANDQFSIRAQGGVRLNTDTSIFCGSQTRQMLNLWGTQYGIGVQSSTTYFRCDNASGTAGFSWFKGGVHNDNQNNPGGGIEMMRLTSSGLTVNGVFVSASDRNLKENFNPVNGREVLEKVATLPLSKWNFKADPESRHVGPMAQDFYAAFGVGPDDKHITTIDESGVALAAIQGLNQKLEEKEARIHELEERLSRLEELVGNQH